MSKVLDAIREKYPQYAEVPDEELTLRIGDKFPTYRDEPDFNKEWSAANLGRTSIKAAPQEEAYMQSREAGAPTLDPSGMRSTDLVEAVASDPTAIPRGIMEEIGVVAAGVGNAPVRLKRALLGTPQRTVITDDEIRTEDEPLPFKQGRPLLNLNTGSELQPEGNHLAQLAEGLTTPEMLATLPFGATKPVQLLFLSQTAPAAVESAMRLVDQNLPEDERKLAASELLLNGIISHGLAKGVLKKPPLAAELAYELDRAPITGTPRIEPPTEIVRPDPRGSAPADTAETAALADAALREAQSPIVVPGRVPAIELLRRQRDDQIVPAGTEPVEFRPGGEAVGGKVSFNRPAEPGRNVSEAAPEPVIEPVRESVTETVTEPVTAKSISEMSPTEFGEFNRSLGANQVAERVRIGRENSPEILNQLADASEAKARAILKDAATDPSKMGEAVAEQQKAQFLREAIRESKESAPAGSEAPKPPAPEPAKPGIISGTQLEMWANGIIREGRTLSLPDPELLAAYGIKGAAILERGVRDFSKWSAEMIKEHGESIKPYLKSIFDESNDALAFPERYQIEGGSLKMRKSAERATTADMVPAPVQERIATAPESFYPQQSMQRVEDAVGAMTETELANVPKTSNYYTAAALERSRRLFEAGKNDEGYSVFAELEKEGTRLGQLINQFKLLKGTRPETVVAVINNTLKNNKRDPLTPVQAEKAVTITKESKAADTALDKATDAWKSNPTPENAKVAEAALDNANAEAVKLQSFVAKFQKKTIPGTLKAVLQGNLLTPMSLTANVVGNMSFLPFRAGARAVATGLDILDNAIRGKGREISIGPVSSTALAAKGLAAGSKQIPGILMRGKGDVIKGERTQGLQPIRAWINQFAKNPEMPTTGGKITLSDRVRLAIEGTFGVSAEAMLRMLSAGDAPFYEAGRGRVIANELRLKNVPKSQWSFARKFPELFFDKETMQQIQQDAAAAVFQRESKSLNFITQLVRNKGDIADLVFATIAPYKLTPWNIIGEIMSYNPLIAFGKTVLDAKKGNSRSAKMSAGKFAVGSMLTGAGWWLYEKGLLSPSLDSKDEANKARVLANEIMPPNHINLSGLKRTLSGGSPEFEPGDETVDIFRAGGLAGALFYMTANIGRQFENMPKEDSDEMYQALISQSTLEQARFGLNQSFLSGVEGLLSAIKDGNSENYVRQYMNTVASIPLPNSLAALSRATRDFKPDFNDSEFFKKAGNVVRNRLGFAGLDDFAPLKIDLWGRPVSETPKGRNAIIYQFFDITKNRQVSSDPIDIELYRLWRRTNNSRVIPSLPEKALTDGGVTYVLDVPQRARMAELVGKNRREIVEEMVVNPEWHKLDDDTKISLLERAYDTGRDIAKSIVLKETEGQLRPKPQKAGFK